MSEAIEPLIYSPDETDRVLIDCIHDQGPEACRGIAFRVTELPSRADPVNVDTIRLLDGTTPNYGELMRCESCHRIIDYGAVTMEGGYA